MSPRRPLPKAPPETASGYVRLSKEAGETNMSKDGMVAEVKALAASRGLTLVAMHVDDGISGAVRDRPEFIEWLDDAKMGRADHLIAHHVDRMTREGVNVAGIIMDTIEGKDPVSGRVVRQPVTLLDTKGLDSGGDETSFRFRFLIAAEVARGERERMRDRARNSNRRARAAGRWPGGPPPFGYRSIPNPNGPGLTLDVEPVEAALIQETAALVLSGSTLSAAVRYANGPDGCLPRRAPLWSRVTLRQVLTGHSAAGRMVKHKDGKVLPILDDKGQPVTFEAILSPDESAALRKVLEPVPDARKGGRHPARMLSGILRCHACDGRMAVARRTDGSVTYRCQTGQESGRCAQPVSVSAIALEEFIAARFLAGYGHLAYKVRRTTVAGAAAVEDAERAVSAALEDLSAAATPEAFKALQEAQARREEALAVPSEVVVTLADSGRTVAEEWALRGVQERRELIMANVADIIVKPGKRGPKGIDPERIVVVAKPAFAGEPEAHRAGRVVVA